MNFFVVPGEIRKCCNVAVPSAWSDRESVIRGYGERDLDIELCADREIELCQLKRNYNELKEMLEVVKRNDMKYLPCKIEIDNYFEDTCINNNNLPDVLMSIVNEYDEKINCCRMNKNTNGDWTKINDVDLVYDKIIIMGGNPMYDYCGKMDEIKFYGYYTQDNHMTVSYTHLDVYKRQM